MTEYIMEISLYALYAATICLLFVLLFIHAPERKWLKAATVALGLAAVGLPFAFVENTLGFPDPRPDPGHYRLLGWDIAETDRAIYLFIEGEDVSRPRAVKVPFLLDRALELQKAEESLGTFRKMSVEIGEDTEVGGPPYEFTFVKAFGDPPAGSAAADEANRSGGDPATGEARTEGDDK